MIGVDKAQVTFTVEALDMAPDNDGEEEPISVRDLEAGIIDLCSQWRERNCHIFTVNELNGIVDTALRNAVLHERTHRG